MVLGAIAGWVARRARFCTFGAIEDMVLIGDLRRLNCVSWALAVAMLAVQLMHIAGIARTCDLAVPAIADADAIP